MTDALEVREAAEAAGRRWIFGSAVLDERTLELQVGGQQVALERKPLEVLLYLLRHAGEVVTKDDLAENLWPGRILTETVLTRCISLLRQALNDDDRTLIRTVHGYGYRLVARVKVEASAVPAPPALEFKAGDCPPTRPQWRLMERLGTGGHGEAWLARHEKTGDARVFKFALDVGALSSLKREITLYRLMHDSLGVRAAVVRILEWNLEEPPYFLEMEYVAGGNLQTWSETQGGLSVMALPARLELVAKIADALAAAHSVGALHKDLKPGNVLIHVDGGEPTIRLCDFGSGTVLDPRRLEALGITRLGFTKTLAQDTTSATPLYIAPEVIAGQPFTVQADIYALGVLLYQVATGDLRRPLAPGWEADVEDELLREDIGAAAAGNPMRRLTDASQVAERLRSLEQRREARAAEVAARLRAERVRRIQQELRRTRVFAALLVVLTLAALTGGVTAYRARSEAVLATATAKAVGDFLKDDVLRLDSGLFRPSEASYEALLNRAANEVDTRLKDQPEAAASIHLLLGRRFQEMAQFDKAATQYEQAVALFTALHGEPADSTLIALERLTWANVERGRPIEARAMAERLLALWESRLDDADLAMLMVRIRTARTCLTLGDYATAESELRLVLSAASTADPSAARVSALFEQWLGIKPPPESATSILMAYANLLLAGAVLEEVGEQHEEIEARLGDSLAIFLGVLGEEAELTNLARIALAVTLSASGKLDVAEQLAVRARDAIDASFPSGHYARGLPRLAVGRLRVQQRRFAEAASNLEDAVLLCSRESGCPPRVLANLKWDLGRAYNELERAGPAIDAFRESLAIQEQLTGPDNVLTLRIRVGLAEALHQARSLDEATAVLSAIEAKTIATLRPNQEAMGDLRRVQGLVYLDTGDARSAVSALEEALKVVQHRAGDAHWRTARLRAELVKAKSAANIQSPNLKGHGKQRIMLPYSRSVFG